MKRAGRRGRATVLAGCGLAGLTTACNAATTDPGAADGNDARAAVAPEASLGPAADALTGASVDPPTPGSSSGYDWSDVRRRRALSLAIDRAAITANILLDSAVPADDWWPPTHAGYEGGATCPNLAFDPDTARALWEEAGGNAGPITLWYNSGSSHDEWIEAVSNMLIANLGVESVEFRSLEFADYLAKLHADEVDGPYRLGWLMAYPSPGGFLGPMHTTGGMANLSGYTNPDIDALVRSGDSKPLADALGDYRSAADILCDDMPVAPIYFAGLHAIHSDRVAGVAFDPFESVRLAELVDLDGPRGDRSVSIKICEPTNGLYGQVTLDLCGGEVVNALFTGLVSLADPAVVNDPAVANDPAAVNDPAVDAGADASARLRTGSPDATPADANQPEVVSPGSVDAATGDSGTGESATGDIDAGIVYDGVATSIETIDDGANWVIKLADGWTFHDGTPVTASSFIDAWNWAALGTNGAANQQFIELLHIRGFDAMNPPDANGDGQPDQTPATELAGLRAADAHTIEIELDAPFPQLPLILAYKTFLPLPETFFDDPAAFGEAPIGNGPFMIDGTWQHDVEISTVAYPGYAGTRPQIDSVVFKIYSDDATAYNDVLAGQLDISDRVPVARLGTYQNEFAGRYVDTVTPAMVYLGFATHSR